MAGDRQYLLQLAVPQHAGTIGTRLESQGSRGLDAVAFPVQSHYTLLTAIPNQPVWGMVFSKAVANREYLALSTLIPKTFTDWGFNIDTAKVLPFH